MYRGGSDPDLYQGSFQVIESMAMLPPKNLVTGKYILEAIYLNRETGEIYPISGPTVTINITPNAPVILAPELDLVTQMRILAGDLPQGRAALDHIFAEIGRINQYAPVQDYTLQAELALEYRLKQEPNNVDLAYALTLSRVLQEDVSGAIAALKKVVELDSQNPYSYAYLAFVYLYDWQPKAAEKALQRAGELNPDIPEIQRCDPPRIRFGVESAPRQCSRVLPLSCRATCSKHGTISLT